MQAQHLKARHTRCRPAHARPPMIEPRARLMRRSLPVPGSSPDRPLEPPSFMEGAVRWPPLNGAQAGAGATQRDDGSFAWGAKCAAQMHKRATGGRWITSDCLKSLFASTALHPHPVVQRNAGRGCPGTRKESRSCIHYVFTILTKQQNVTGLVVESVFALRSPNHMRASREKHGALPGPTPKI